MRSWRCGLVGCVVGLVVLATGVSTPTSTAAAGDDPLVASYADYSYAAGVDRPTADKPQSKLWYAYGSWWALMATRDDGTVHIFELTRQHSWRDTDVVVDTRPNSTGDVLWDGSEAYVASRASDGPVQVSRFTFDDAARTWSRGSPVELVGEGGVPSATLAKDSLGRLWLTYTEDQQVWVAHTTEQDRDWTAPFPPAVPDSSVSSDDISSVVGFDNKIGVMWSDQVSDRFVFAVHEDGDDDAQWSVEVASKGYLEVDNHISLATAPSADGTQVLAAVKTSQDDIPGVPTAAEQIAVLLRSPSGEWTSVPAGTVADGHTRPILVVDSANRQVYLVAAVEGSGVYYKRSPLTEISFPDGRGEPLMAVPGRSIGNPTASKAAVSDDGGIVVLATAAGTGKYYHAEIALPAPPGRADAVPPRRPESLFAAASAGCQVELLWPPASDDVGVLRYEVRRDDRVLARTTSTGYLDPSAGCDATHRYAVTTVDTSGNASRERETAAVTTPASVHAGVGIWLAGSSASINAGGRQISVPIPPSKPGDLVIVSIDAAGAPALDPPRGWRLVQRNVQPSTLVKSTYVRVVTGREGVAARWSLGRRASAIGTALAYRGVDADDPVVAAVGQSNTPAARIETPPLLGADAAATPAGTGPTVVALFAAAGLVALTPSEDLVPQVTRTNYYNGDALTSGTAQLGDPDLATGALTAEVSRPWPSIGQLIALRPEGDT